MSSLRYCLDDLSHANSSMLPLVGGKAARLGELMAIPGVSVPPGFVVTTAAFDRFLAEAKKCNGRSIFDHLRWLCSDECTDVDKMGNIVSSAKQLREKLQLTSMPMDVMSEIRQTVSRFYTNARARKRTKEGDSNNDDDDDGRYEGECREQEEHLLVLAVRSSAVCEDRPDLSFAGQHDTILNVTIKENKVNAHLIGGDQLLDAVKTCWISMFSHRAVMYRMRNGFQVVPPETSSRQSAPPTTATTRGVAAAVSMAVVIQKQVDAAASGVAFTADPVDGRRHIVSIEATFGLGELLVSGRVTPDRFTFNTRSGQVEERLVATQNARRFTATLTNSQVRQLSNVACKIEANFNGVPQDIEFCFESSKKKKDGEENELFIVQARPVTPPLYPIPNSGRPDDKHLRVFISFNHAQGTTDAISPLGCDVYRCAYPFSKDKNTHRSRVMQEGGGHLFYEMTDGLRLGLGRSILMRFISLGDPQIASRVENVCSRPEVRNCPAPLVSTWEFLVGVVKFWWWIILRCLFHIFFGTPEGTAERVEAMFSEEIDKRRRHLDIVMPSAKTRKRNWREQLLRCEDVIDSAFYLAAQTMPQYTEAAHFCERALRFLVTTEKQKDDVDAIKRGVPGNVTVEMELALVDVAETARSEPAAMDFLLQQHQQEQDDGGSDEEPRKFYAAVAAFLEKFGSRAATEIDIARPRFRDDPNRFVIPLIRQHFYDAEIGQMGDGTFFSSRRTAFLKQTKEAERATFRLCASVPFYLRPVVTRLIRCVRGYSPIREAPKFFFVRVLWYVRVILLEFADLLVDGGVFAKRDDVFFLKLSELTKLAMQLEDDAVEGVPTNVDKIRHSVRELVARRRAEFAFHQTLTPPRVMTSDGEIIQPLQKHQQEQKNRTTSTTTTTTAQNTSLLFGTPASAGLVEGIAHVVTSLGEGSSRKNVSQQQQPFDNNNCQKSSNNSILVVPNSDPAWTSMFSGRAGLVLEVGGMHSHGAVVAREMGIPTVSGVDGATTVIRSGQRIRVNGNEGVVELL